MSYTARIAHDGRTYQLEIPDIRIPKCCSCGELIFSHSVDDQIRCALRSHLHLLTPEQLQERRNALGLSAQELAEQLGVTEETCSRWETGLLIQSRAIDNLLRLFFTSAEVRTLLRKGFESSPLPLTHIA
jgi:putative zinc finger/helix-turn-helix YgiT family protein